MNLSDGPVLRSPSRPDRPRICAKSSSAGGIPSQNNSQQFDELMPREPAFVITSRDFFWPANIVAVKKLNERSDLVVVFAEQHIPPRVVPLRDAAVKQKVVAKVVLAAHVLKQSESCGELIFFVSLLARSVHRRAEQLRGGAGNSSMNSLMLKTGLSRDQLSMLAVSDWAK